MARNVSVKVTLTAEGTAELDKIIAGFGNLSQVEAEATKSGKDLYAMLQANIRAINELAEATKRSENLTTKEQAELGKIITGLGNLSRVEAEATKSGKDLYAALQADIRAINELAEAAKRGESLKVVAAASKDADAAARVLRAAGEAAKQAGAETEEEMGRILKDWAQNTQQASRVLQAAFEEIPPQPKRENVAAWQQQIAMIERLLVRVVALAAVREIFNRIRDAFKETVEVARFQDISAAFDKMSEHFGQSSNVLLQALRSVSHETVDDMKLMQAAITGMSLTEGVLAQDLPKAMGLTRMAALATGRDVDTLFEKLVLGIGRLSPRLIDDLGISIKLSEAYERYAQSVGKSATELTAVEQRQAVWNEVMRKGKEVYGDFTQGVELSVDVFSQAEVAATKLAREISFSLLPLTKTAAEIWGKFASSTAESMARDREAAEEFAHSRQVILATSKSYDDYVNKVNEAARSLSDMGVLQATIALILDRFTYEQQKAAAAQAYAVEESKAMSIALGDVAESIRPVVQVQEDLRAVLLNLGSAYPRQEIENFLERLKEEYGLTSDQIIANSALIASLIKQGAAYREVTEAVRQATLMEDVYFRQQAAATAQYRIALDVRQQLDREFARAHEEDTRYAYMTDEEKHRRFLQIQEEATRAERTRTLAMKYHTAQQVEAALRLREITEDQARAIMQAWSSMSTGVRGGARQIEVEENRLTDTLHDVYERRLEAVQRYNAAVESENEAYADRVESIHRTLQERLQRLDEDFRTRTQRDDEDFQNNRRDQLEAAEREIGTDARNAIQKFLEDKAKLQAEDNEAEIQRRRQALVRNFGVEADALLDRIEEEDRDRALRKQRQQEDYDRQREEAKKAHDRQLHDLREAHDRRLREIQRALAEQQAAINRAFAERLRSLIQVLKDEDFALLEEYGPEGLARINWNNYVSWLSEHPAVRKVITEYLSQGSSGNPPEGVEPVPPPPGGSGGSQPPEEGRGSQPPAEQPREEKPRPVVPLPPRCFVGETRISGPDGAVQIADICPGDKIWSFDGERLVVTRVAEVVSRHNAEVWTFEFDGSRSVTCTPDHRVFVPEMREYVPLGLLMPGTVVLRVCDGQVGLTRLTGRWPGVDRATVYNLEIDHAAHNYFANGILVHNVKPQVAGAQFGFRGWIERPTQLLVGEAGPEWVEVIPRYRRQELEHRPQYGRRLLQAGAELEHRSLYGRQMLQAETELEPGGRGLGKWPGVFCFVGSTRIATPLGERPISDLKIGDMVWAWSDEGLVATDITRTVFRHDVEIWIFVLSDGLELICSPQHRANIYGSDKYEPLGNVGLGTTLSCLSINTLKPVFLTGYVKSWKRATVYNFEVSHPAHNYFANGVLVHNDKEQILAQAGFHGLVQRPTVILAGEHGPERVDIAPAGQVNVQVSGELRDRLSIFLDGELVSYVTSRRLAARARTISKFVAR